MSKVETKLMAIPDAVAEKLERVLADKNEFKRLTANKGEELKQWLTMEVSDRMEPVSRNLEGELRRQGEHLVERLRPILEKIDNSESFTVRMNLYTVKGNMLTLNVNGNYMPDDTNTMDYMVMLSKAQNEISSAV